MGSLGQALRRAGGVGRGRAVVAIVLVAALLVAQSMEVSDSAASLGATGAWILPSLCLSGLGAIVGFWAARLRAASGWRTVARRFGVSALLVQGLVVLIAALAIGPALTAVSRQTYAVDPGSWTYLLNLVAIPRYTLPGVFDDNNVPEVVNQWAWLAPFFLVLLALVCALPVRRSAWPLSAGLFVLVALAALIGQAIEFVPAAPDSLVSLLIQGDGLTLVLAVLLGLVMAARREDVPMNGWLAAGAAAMLALAAWRGSPALLAFPAFRIIEVVPAAYLAVTMAARRLPLSTRAARAEPVLPAVFLLAFPLQQAAASAGPHPQRFLINLALAVPVTVAIAAAFWWGVGRRVTVWAPPPTSVADDEPRLGLRDMIGGARQIRPADLGRGMVLSLALSVVFMMVMALLYIAAAPDGAG